MVILNTLKHSFVIDCDNKRKRYHYIWRFQPQVRGDLFVPGLDRVFAFLRSFLTDRSVVEGGQLQYPNSEIPVL